MQAIMLYFSGSGVQIFSLGMIFMLVTGPITAVFSIFRGSSQPTKLQTKLINGQPSRRSDLHHNRQEERMWRRSPSRVMRL